MKKHQESTATKTVRGPGGLRGPGGDPPAPGRSVTVMVSRSLTGLPRWAFQYSPAAEAAPPARIMVSESLSAGVKPRAIPSTEAMPPAQGAGEVDTGGKGAHPAKCCQGPGGVPGGQGPDKEKHRPRGNEQQVPEILEAKVNQGSQGKQGETGKKGRGTQKS